ncbi:hypothetical protein ADL19_04935 [Streptomyces purpurogeneiscleroticus]|nr:hypothetical protein ADL19_04935 [Streptomyces purpurogeneiscleroticus]
MALTPLILTVAMSKRCRSSQTLPPANAQPRAAMKPSAFSRAAIALFIRPAALSAVIRSRGRSRSM